MAMDMNVALKISAGVTGQQAVDQLRTSMDKLQGAASSIGRGFDLAKTAVVGFLGVQAVQQIAGIGSALINAADRMNDLSERTGYTVEQLSALEYAAKMNGASLEEVQSALGRVSAKAVDAATGGKQAALAFQALGVDVKSADGTMRSSVDIMQDVGAALGDITDQTLRTAVAREIFGKNADALLPFLMNMREAQAEAQNLGAVMSGDFAAKSAEFNDNLDRIGFQLRGIGNTILAELLPGMNALAESMLQNSKNGGALQLIADGIRIAFEAIVVVGGNLIYVFKQIGNEAIGIGRQMAALATMDFDGFSRIGEQMRKDAAQARKEIDAWSESILNAGKQSAGAGRGFFNPDNVKATNDANQRAVGILRQLTQASKTQTDAEKLAAQQDRDRKQILESLGDEITKLTFGEDQLTIAKLRRLGATEQEIAQAQELMRQRGHMLAMDRELDDATREASRLQEERKNRADQLKQAFEALNGEITSMKQGEDALVIAKLRSLGATDQEIAKARELLTEKQKLKQADKDMESAKQIFEETRTPAEKLNIEIARLNDLLQKGAIDWDTYSRAVFKAQDDFDGTAKKGKDSMADLKQAVEGWGRQATDAFVDFAFTGKASFKDMVNSILQDIARMLIQKAVMGPLMSTIGSMFGFANGGIMTDQGPLPLNKYANGGIATSPQLAMFGEGSMPEAYVPLPDGRSIPVTMDGAATGTNVVVNVNVESGQTQVTGDQGAGLGRIIAQVVKAELINQKRPGGLLAA